MQEKRQSYTRVTQILSIFQSYAHVPKEKLKKAQEIGTDVHEAIELYFKNEFKALESKKTPYFESFLKWVDVSRPKLILAEERLYNDDLEVTGKFDLIAEINGQNCLIDFKTGQYVHQKIWSLQLHWYYLLLDQDHENIDIDKFLVVQLSPIGESPLLFEITPTSTTLEVCNHSLELYRHFSNNV
jgi:hypothetical protein